MPPGKLVLVAKRRPRRRKPARNPKRGGVLVKSNPFTSNAFTVLPDTRIIKLKYSDTYPLASTAAPALKILRGNSIFDPDQSGVGHQPLGHDEINSFYLRYYVFKTEIIAKFSPNAAAPIKCVLVPTDQSSSFANISHAAEQARAQTGLVGYNGNTVTLKGIWNTSAIRGQHPNDLDDLQAQFGANPVLQWFIHLYTQDADLATNVTSYVDVTLVYHVKVMRRVALSQS